MLQQEMIYLSHPVECTNFVKGLALENGRIIDVKRLFPPKKVH